MCIGGSAPAPVRAPEVRPTPQVAQVTRDVSGARRRQQASLTDVNPAFLVGELSGNTAGAGLLG